MASHSPRADLASCTIPARFVIAAAPLAWTSGTRPSSHACPFQPVPVSSHAVPRGTVNGTLAYAVIARADGWDPAPTCCRPRVLPFPAGLQPAERGCARCSARPDDVLALAAQLVDAELHDVARLQPDRRREPHPDAGRRSGVDEIPGLQDEKLAQVVHDEVRVED